MNGIRKTGHGGRTLSRRGGFTLVEVIVVLVIISILAAIMIPSLVDYIRRGQEKAAIAECRSCVLAAQTLASESYALGSPYSAGTVDAAAHADIMALSEQKGKIESVEVGANKAVITKLVYTASNGITVTYENGEFTIGGTSSGGAGGDTTTTTTATPVVPDTPGGVGELKPSEGLQLPSGLIDIDNSSEQNRINSGTQNAMYIKDKFQASLDTFLTENNGVGIKQSAEFKINISGNLSVANVAISDKNNLNSKFTQLLKESLKSNNTTSKPNIDCIVTIGADNKVSNIEITIDGKVYSYS